MKRQRQLKVLRILGNGKYRIDLDSGEVYTKLRGKWELKEPSLLSAGYLMYKLHYRGGFIYIYGHELVYLSGVGEYGLDDFILHKNGMRVDNRLVNLACVSGENRSEWLSRNRLSKGGKLLRGISLLKIFELHDSGSSISSIASYLGLNRSTVRYHVKKYKAGDSKWRYLKDLTESHASLENEVRKLKAGAAVSNRP